MHSILKAVLNSQASLQVAITSMQSKLRRGYQNIHEKKNQSRIDRPRLIDLINFHLLIDHIIIGAIKRIKPEGVSALKLAKKPVKEGPCCCSLLIHLNLPCRHYLLRAAIEGFVISMSLIYSYGGIDSLGTPYEGRPEYYDATINSDDSRPSRYQNPATNKFLNTVSDLQQLH